MNIKTLFICLVFFPCIASFEDELSAKKQEIAVNWISIPMSARDRIVPSPYISGDAFRMMSKHIFDETDAIFNSNDVKQADTIFVSGDFLELFFNYVHPKISNDYILITHNSDWSFPGKFINYLNESKILAWFTVNADIKHEKIKPIPIGFQNHHWNKTRDLVISQVLRNQRKTRHLAIMNFRAGTNQALREPVFNRFKTQEYCYCANTDKSFKNYLIDLFSSKYCISPFGNGKDCHRVYEAIAMGCIPIVCTSTLDDLYKKMPILIIDNWEVVNQQFLEEKYLKEYAYNFDKSALYMEYWRAEIEKFAASVR